MSVRGQRPAYTESQVIMTSVRVVAPFVFTYGLFVTFHGADAPGGGFQGGAIVAAVFLMIAFAFGIQPTRDWLRNDIAMAAVGLGVVVFAGVGLGTIALGGSFLDYALYPVPDAGKWGMELVEIGGIAPIVAGVLTGLFFVMSTGWFQEDDAEGDSE